MLVAAGGTVGHLAPALAVADQLRDAGHDVSFAASSGRRDADLLTERGYDAELFAIGGLPRSLGLAQISALGRAIAAVFICLRIVGRVKPDVLLAGGGFVSAPMAIAAWVRRVPVVATEADAHLGLANRMSGRVAQRLCTAYPLRQLRAKQEVTGRPVSAAFFAAASEEARSEARRTFELPDDARVVAIVGGSGGATKLNNAALDAWAAATEPTAGGEPIWILHVTGRRDFAAATARSVASDRYRIIEYCEAMPALLAAADLVISRPGGSVFELAAVGRASVLVPSPHVTADHQTSNARWFVDRGAAVLVEDQGIDGDHMRGLVEDLLGPAGDARRSELADAMAALARPTAAARIATIVAQCGSAKRRTRPMDDAAMLRDGTPIVTRDVTRDVTASAAPGLPLAGRTFHLLGAGGAGVSALAQLTRAWGGEVSGCDQTESEYSTLVRASGVPVAIGHDPSHILPGMEVVVSSALAADHPELERARQLDCRVVLRGEHLGELTSLRDTVVVAGAHGKSTTTGMLAHAAVLLGLDPAAALGATMPGLGTDGVVTNVLTGDGPFLVEGDESDRTLLHLRAKVAIVTNIERDHHHTFANDEEVESLFAEWVSSLDPDSLLVLGPGEACDRLAPHAAGRCVRFGMDDAELDEIEHSLGVPGRHNALNAAAAIAALDAIANVDAAAALGALTSFTGVGRRFEIIGEAAGVLVVDDYAHHPTEVVATLQAARGRAHERHGRVLVAFQPHLYTRTAALWERFAAALALADRAWVLPIYGAREAPIEDVDERLIALALQTGAPKVYAGRGMDDPATGDVATILEETMTGDILITMGAGSVTQLAPRLVEGLAARGASSIEVPAWIERDVPLHKFTTIGTGGPARYFVKAASIERLTEALAWARAHTISFAMVGLGSNSLIADDGFEGLAIRLVDDLARIDIDAESRRAVLGGGASLAASVRLLRDAGLAGFEFACAIPGTAGGATKMNAGAYGGEMCDVLTRIRIVTADGTRDAEPAELAMTYRHTNIAWNEVVAEIEIALEEGEPDVIKARVKEMQGRRSDTQPRAARSFGSVFQNPKGELPDATQDSRDADGAVLGAGALIERVDLKGHRIGGARISPKHGNFIENDEAGTTSDIIALIDLARAKVLDRFGVQLRTEVHLLDIDGYRPLHGAAPDSPGTA